MANVESLKIATHFCWCSPRCSRIMFDCANDLKSVTVRVLHVAANYYEARRLHGRLGVFTESEIHINISQKRLQCIPSFRHSS